MKISLTLDKFDKELLDSRKKRTGKNMEEIIKLALLVLHEKLDNKHGEPVVISSQIPLPHKRESQTLPDWPTTITCIR